MLRRDGQCQLVEPDRARVLEVESDRACAAGKAPESVRALSAHVAQRRPRHLGASEPAGGVDGGVDGGVAGGAPCGGPPPPPPPPPPGPRPMIAMSSAIAFCLASGGSPSRQARISGCEGAPW